MNFNKYRFKKGFTLIEVLVVIAIIGVLASVSFSIVSDSYDKSYMAKALAEARQIEAALMVRQIDHGSYPPDADRGVVPDGLDDLIDENIWQEGPWPGSVYDWDHWVYPDHSPSEEVYQISVRFCDKGGINCRYPGADWAKHFDQRSAFFGVLKDLVGPIKVNL